MTALAADASENFAHVVKQVPVVHRLNQLDVAEMAGAVHLRTVARLAESVLVHRAHQVIVDAARDGVTALAISLLLTDRRDTEACDVFLREHGKG